ncbi:3-hydroxyacyl-CoA dehydrogenase NAD-binding domain-containing protein [Luminiphilus sp.]|nr:3-hydroxyacyl-CoA dehydrogenase NAD-binding domain-containing protein [Luminiphilus sp.]
MSDSNIEKVAMIGAGTLGGQIAWHSAYMGKQVKVYDISAEGLKKCQTAQAGYAAIYSTDLNASDDDIEATRAADFHHGSRRSRKQCRSRDRGSA